VNRTAQTRALPERAGKSGIEEATAYAGERLFWLNALPHGHTKWLGQKHAEQDHHNAGLVSLGS